MLTVACVLRDGGGSYDQNWVLRLKENVAKHLTVPYKFVCLTNLPDIKNVETIRLTEAFPGWWSKIELFKPGRFSGPVLYLDLDLMACGNIDQLVGPWDSLVMLKDCPAFRHVANSGLMWFDPTKNSALATIFMEFKNDFLQIMQDYSGKNGVTMFGDQGFVEKTMAKMNQPILKWQDILPPDWFLEFSYLDKINPLVEADTHNKDVRICYSLGYPKFHNYPHLPIVKQHWDV
jgi:hypothetical protein